MRRGDVCSKVSVTFGLEIAQTPRAVIEKCYFQTYGIQRKRESSDYQYYRLNHLWQMEQVIQHIALVHKYLHSSAQCIHSHTASTDTYSCKCPVLTGSANPLSGKSSSGCTPVAQRVWNQYQWAAGGHCKPVFPLNGSFLKAVQCADGHWTTGILREALRHILLRLIPKVTIFEVLLYSEPKSYICWKLRSKLT